MTQPTTSAPAAAAAPRERADQRATPYLDAVRAFADDLPVRLNVPGHKGVAATSPALRRALGDRSHALDLPPLLWGIDDGPRPTPMDESLELAAQAWGARRTWFLTNGASQGNQMTCLALRSLGRRVIVQRSVHSSVVDGLVLAGLEPVFVAPSVDAELGIAHGVTPAQLAAAFAAAPDAVAAIVVSPSYFGAVADVGGLAAVAAAAGAALVADESWGAHFGFHPALPSSALSLGADVVVSSTHKLAGSLTQSAMLHLGHGPRAAALEEQLDRALGTVQSTSASSLLYASLDAARSALACTAPEGVEPALAAAERLREHVGGLPGLRVAGPSFLAHDDVVAIDPLRVAIDVRGCGTSGYEAAAFLRRRHRMHVEVKNAAALVAVFGATDRGDDLPGALAALSELAGRRRRHGTDAEEAQRWPVAPPWQPAVRSPRAAWFAPAEVVPAAAAVGRISADTLAAYPPGIPNVLPGEPITAELVGFLRATVVRGGHVRGGTGDDATTLRVVAEPGSTGARR